MVDRIDYFESIIMNNVHSVISRYKTVFANGPQTGTAP